MRPAQKDRVGDPAGQPVGALAREAYRAVACYAPDEAECWPSQQTIADDMGVCRETVNRCIAELIEAGWLRIKWRRWSPFTCWQHNGYELLEAFAVSPLAMKRITRRAHRRGRRQTRLMVAARAEIRGGPVENLGLDHTNKVVTGFECGCRACRVDLASIGRSPPRLIAPDWHQRVHHFFIDQQKALRALDRRLEVEV